MKRRPRESQFTMRLYPRSHKRNQVRYQGITTLLIQTTLSFEEIAAKVGDGVTADTVESHAKENSLRQFTPVLGQWGKKIKALTVMQPYAELIRRGLKRVENRTFPMWKMGAGLVPTPTSPVTLLIHAGRGQNWWTDQYGIRPNECAWGAAVAMARFVGCVLKSDLRSWVVLHAERYGWLSHHEHANGPWCWIMQDVVPLLRPVPMPGRQGIWDCPSSLITPHAPLCPEHHICFCGCPKVRAMLVKSGAVAREEKS